MPSSTRTAQAIQSPISHRITRAVFKPVCMALVLAAIAGVQPAKAVERGSSAFLSTKRVVQPPNGARSICQRYSWACASSGQSALVNGQQMRLIRSVNSHVNAKVRPVTDKRQYRTEEYWALPTRRGGDCEDFALLKKRELIKRGIPPERLLIATVLDRKRNAHAVLVVRTSQGDYVLDNLTNRVLPWKKTGYSFIRMQSPKSPKSWTIVLKGGIFSKRG